MNKESEKREIINDANIYGCGIKRFSEGHRLKPYANGLPVNYYIDQFLIMPLDSTTIYLMIFENNVVGLYNQNTNCYEEFNRLVRKKIGLVLFISHINKLQNLQRSQLINKSKLENEYKNKFPSRTNKSLLSKSQIKRIENQDSFIKSSTLIHSTTKNQDQQIVDLKMKKPVQKPTNKRIEFQNILESSEKLTDSRKRNQISLQKSTVAESTYQESTAYKKKRPGKLYGILGVVHLDEDDNILMRGNLNPKNDISLKLKNDYAKFKSDFDEKERELKQVEREIKRRKLEKLKKANDDKQKTKGRDTLEGYDHTKYNVGIRIDNFTSKIKVVETSIKGISEGIKHIPSVGDPYIMISKNKRSKTLYGRRRNLPQNEGSKDIFARISQFEHKNTIREKADKKKEQNLAKQTKKIHCSFACFHKETKTLVISLIDKEVKVYKFKENGSRITVENRFSFYVKHTVTYLEIEKYIVNDKIILIAGTEDGKIEIYYIDEKPMFEQQIMKKNLKDKAQDGNDKLIHKEIDSRNSALLLKMIDMDPDRMLHIVKLRYARDIGLISCALNDYKATINYIHI